MKSFAWINKETELIENIISYDGVTPIELPPNMVPEATKAEIFPVPEAGKPMAVFEFVQLNVVLVDPVKLTGLKLSSLQRC